MSEIIDLEPYDNEPAELEVSEAVIEAVSPKVSTEAIEGGHRVTVTDVDGSKTFDVMDGADGQDGERGLPGLNGRDGQDGETPLMTASKTGTTTTVTFSTSRYQESFQIADGAAGAPGRNGVSPQATVTKEGNTATIRIADLSGVTTATVSDGATGAQGEPGRDGVSPTITVTDITGGHRVTITDATGAHSFDVMDGEKGGKGDTGPAGPAGADYVLTAADKAEIARMVDVSGKMDEPATEGTAGQVLTTDGQGGRSWASVGGETVTVSGTTPSITGMAGVRYVCGECATLDIIAPATGCIDVIFTSGSTPTALTVTSAKANTTIKWANGFDPSSLEADTVYEINILDGELGVAGAWS